MVSDTYRYGQQLARIKEQLETNTSIEVEIQSFSNWNGKIQRDYVFVVRPSTIEEVQEIVKAAKKQGIYKMLLFKLKGQ